MARQTPKIIVASMHSASTHMRMDIEQLESIRITPCGRRHRPSRQSFVGSFTEAKDLTGV